MHAHLLDNHSAGESPIHRLPAGTKVACALAAVVALVSVPVRWAWVFASVGALLAIVTVLSRVPWLFLLKRLLLMEPAVLGVALLTLLGPGGAKAFATILLRSTLCMAVLLLLANTTSFSQILLVLRRLRVPALLVTTLALMYRYLFVLAEEGRRLRRARACRTFTPGRRRDWKASAGVIGQLFVRSVDRAERVYAAMCARGWQ